MFSYPAGFLQTTAAKRAENHFNGVSASSSGEATTVESARSFPPLMPRADI
jgi:hypothetical protein